MKRPKLLSHLLQPAVWLFFIAALSSPIRAADGTWNNPAGGAWNVAGNWLGGMASDIADGSGSTAYFNNLDLTGDIAVTLGANRIIGNLVFGDTTPSGHGWSLSGANTLTLAGTTPTITVNDLGAGSVTISSVIAGSVGLTKAGSGLLILGNNNTFTGGVTISGGTLRSTVSGAIQGNVAVASGATWQLHTTPSTTRIEGISGSGIIENSSGALTLTVGNNNATSTFSGTIRDGVGSLALTKVGNGTLTLNGTNSFTGDLTINGGTVVTGNLSVSDSSKFINFSNGGILQASGNFSTNRRLSFIGAGTVDTQEFNATVGRFNLNQGNFTKIGSGKLTIGATGNNTGPANVYVNEGTLAGGADRAFYQNNFHVAAGATLDLGGYAYSSNNAILFSLGLNGAGNVTTTVGGTLAFNYGNFSGNLQQGNLQVIGANNVGTTLNPGILTLSGTNSYAGTTTISTGELIVTGSTANSSSYTVAANAKLQVGNDTATGNIGSGNITNQGTVEFKRTNALTVANVISGNGGIIQSGAGKTTLTQNNSYKGATQITAGTLVIDGNQSAATGAVTVQNGGTLGGSGTVGGIVTVQGGGTLSPGNSPGNQNVAGLVFSNGGNYNWQVYDATGAAGTGYDTYTIAPSGTLDLSALTGAVKFNINLWSLSAISPSDTNGPAVNFNNLSDATWILVSTSQAIANFDAGDFQINVGAFNGTGGFANLLHGGSFSVVLSDDGTDLLLKFAAIPEPSASLLLGGGLMVILFLRRRRMPH